MTHRILRAIQGEHDVICIEREQAFDEDPGFAALASEGKRTVLK
jgi:hypothetical protein